MARFLLLDGYSLAFRAYFALKDAGMITSSGQETGAVFGFTSMVAKLLEDQAPDGLAVAFDPPGPTFRDAIVSDYKAGRAATPEPLVEQIELIRRIVELSGIESAEVLGFEADDVIATLATELEGAGHEVIVVTGDRDSYQLVHDPLVKVLYNRRGVTDYVLYDEAGILERTGVRPEHYPLFASLRGDPSDNLPGVPGVGEKTAARLVNTYLDADRLYAHLEDLTPKLRSSLGEHEAQVRSNMVMTPLVRDVPLGLRPEDLSFGPPDRDALASLFDLLQIRGPRDRLVKQLDLAQARSGSKNAAGPGSGEAPARIAQDDPPRPQHFELSVLSTAAEASTVVRELAGALGAVVVEPAWAGAPGRSSIEGLALLCPEASADFDTVGVSWLPGALMSDPAVHDALVLLFGLGQGGSRRIVGHQVRELMRALGSRGIDLDGLDLDIGVASYLVDPRLGQATIAELALRAGLVEDGDGGRETGGARQLGFSWEGQPGDEAPGGDVANRAGERALMLADLAPRVREELDQVGAIRLYEDVERPLIAVLAKMEIVGIGVDAQRLRAINEELTARARELESEIQRLAGEDFKVNSTPQLRRILFDKLGLVPQKRTKTGFSTDAQSLSRMRGSHLIVESLLAYREVEKLRSTYGEGLLGEVGSDGRIHASFNQTVARTGRLSSDQPNLHNIPIRSLIGRRFREAFVPAPGSELVVADYDQIELRVIAHLSGDPGLVEAFRAGIDIHNATASRVFGVDPDKVTLAMRSKAKMISYGLAYGMEAYGLSQRLGVGVEEASEILSQYFAAFPNVRQYMERSVAEARDRGYTETLLGRRRYLPELDSSSFRVRQAAERQAMNAGIQGLAADIFKLALVDLDLGLTQAGMRSRIVLQVHDEILVEAPEDERDRAVALTASAMERAFDLSVPLAVHVAVGDSWAAGKDASPGPDEPEDDLVDEVGDLGASGASGDVGVIEE